MKILIADNSSETREILNRMFLEDGHTCAFVKESHAVMEKVYEESPDIILLSLKLLKPNSLEILRTLKSAPSTRDIPVILMASKRSHKMLSKGYELGAFDYICKPFFKEEIMARIRNISHAVEKINELKALLDRDYLTGIYNRKFFMERLTEEIAWCIRYKECLSIMMLDVDYFKKINDTYGHSCGDEVLKQISNVLQEMLRTEDIVARYGGEEFIILLPSTNIDGAMVAAEKIRSAVQNRVFFCNCDNIRLSVTISGGLAMYDGISEPSSDRLIGEADNALYAAKAAGRNRVICYNRQMQINS